MHAQYRFGMLFLLMIVLSGMVAFAQGGDAEDPSDNACFAGGAWEGKCQWATEAETDWAWTCGWYLARVLDGRISQAPASCLPIQIPMIEVFCVDILSATNVCIDANGHYVSGTLLSTGQPLYMLGGYNERNSLSCALYPYASITRFISNISTHFPSLTMISGSVCLYRD